MHVVLFRFNLGPSAHSRFSFNMKQSLFDDGVGRIELSDSGAASCDPAPHVDFLRICQAASRRVGNDLKQSVRGEVFVVVDVGLDDYAGRAAYNSLFRLRGM